MAKSELNSGNTPLEGHDEAPSLLDSCEAILKVDRGATKIKLTEFTTFSDVPARGGEPQFLTAASITWSGDVSIGNQPAGHVVGEDRDLKTEAQNRTFKADLPRFVEREAEASAEGDSDLETEGESSEMGTDRYLEELTSEKRQTRTSETTSEENVAQNGDTAKQLRAMARILFGEEGARRHQSFVTDRSDPSRQPFDSLSPLVAVCNVYEQTWKLVGYSRGELVGSLTLAPGERVTLDVHTWDKTSRKSEEEISTESEIRTSEKLTQRDALSVSQEYSRQTNSNINGNVTVPIPSMPVGISAGTSTQVSRGWRSTKESVTEKTVEAANALKLTRKTKIELSRESGREERQTRIIENTNRCRSLNCYYFEVIANYLVSTRLVSVRPCLLFKNFKPTISVEWVLCHEGTLIGSLLDRTFLLGFAAAKTLAIRAVASGVQAQLDVDAAANLSARIAPAARGIVHSYRELTEALESLEEAIDECSPFDRDCFSGKTSRLEVERAAILKMISARSRAAIAKLESDINAGVDALTAFGSFFGTVGSGSVIDTVSPEVLMDRMPPAEGVGEILIKAVLSRDPTSFDDAGLRGHVESASAMFNSRAGIGQQDTTADIETYAEAKVEFDRLHCHIEENWEHYLQAVLLRGGAGPSFQRFRFGMGSIPIEHELLGFYQGRSAYPIANSGAVSGANLREIVEAATKFIKGQEDTPVTIALPTAGVVLEATTGECDACEEYIQRSRDFDLVRQSGLAEQERYEADRRKRMLEQTPPILTGFGPAPCTPVTAPPPQ